MIKINWAKIVLVLFILMLGIVFLNQIGLFEQQVSTYPALEKDLKAEHEVDAIIFRHEWNIVPTEGGKVTMMVQDGTRVAANEIIASIEPVSSEAYLPYEIDPTLMIDIQPVLDDYKNKQDTLSFFVKENRYDEAQQIKAQLEMLLEIKAAYDKQSKLLEGPILSAGTMDGTRLIIKAPHPGIVSTNISLMDPLFTPENMYLLNYEKLRDISAGTVITEAKKDQPILRIVDNREFFIVFAITDEELTEYTTGKRIKANINGYTISPIVDSVVPSGKGYLAVLKVIEDFPNAWNERRMKITVTTLQMKGLAIKNSSLIEVDKQLGVYVVNKKFEPEFVPVKFLGRFGDESIIVSDSFTTTDANGQVNETQTVSIYDEIVEEPNVK